MDRPVSLLAGAPDHRTDFSYFTEQELSFAQAFHRSMPQYEETPLVSLHGLAQRLGIKNIFLKDESKRFGLNAFKGLGASFAIARLLWEDLELTGAPDYAALTTPEARAHACNRVFATATDGNHGKSVAWSASVFGCKARVYMPKGSKESRVQAIRAINDTPVEVTELNYDDAVRLAAEWAKENGQTLVQDTGTAEYTKIPRDIALGYTTMAAEALEQMKAQSEAEPTHVFLQAGVGSMAGGVLAYLEQRLTANPPYAVIVEPDAVACIFESAKSGTGRPAAIGGNPETIMAGLNCGEPNPLTWPVLRDFASCYAACPDWVTELGMRTLAHPNDGDTRVVSGESGAVGLGLLVHLCLAPEMRAERQRMGLDENATVLLFSTEGDTDPEAYRSIVEAAKNKKE
ncbi:diaminopropionate ammonia-lyase [Faecalispora anaeroviscerum]|uniref:diaminopropionate ammonia-lyase n=1 Tax=Faecalispora anaeroviscerum TaxID=2991836 RepID=UPI0024B9B8CC|nr:diaminopropionate ammonia-lyase [Faecalispora anaeroviscerum]